MKIHLQSDVHIEMGGPTVFPSVSSDVVVCAGDIGSLSNTDTLSKYFAEIRKTTDNIIWVLGNHEFYNADYDEVLKTAEAFANNEGIYLLDEALGTENLEINGVTFWGSTLWTNFHNNDWFVKQKVKDAINDFHVIQQNHRTLITDTVLNINRRSREKINWNADVIVTHFAPIVIPHPHFPVNEITYYFCNTGLEEKIIESNAKYWIYGHTHHSNVTDLENTLVVSNQHGYSSAGMRVWQDRAGYDPHLILEI